MAFTLPFNVPSQMRIVLPRPARKTGWKHRRHLLFLRKVDRCNAKSSEFRAKGLVNHLTMIYPALRNF